MPLPLILAAAQIGMQLYGGYKAKQEAEEQALIEEEITREELRRMDVGQAQDVGTARSIAGASGVALTSGSTQRFLEAQRNEFLRERAFTAKAGATTAARVRTQGQQAQLASLGQAIGTAASTASNYESSASKPAPTTTPINIDAGVKPQSFGGYGKPNVAQIGSIGTSKNPYSGSWGSR